MQEIESWVEEEQVGLSIGRETSDEVSFTPLNLFFKSWFDNIMKVERKFYSSFWTVVLKSTFCNKL